MGHKKQRNLAPRSKTSSPAAVSPSPPSVDGGEISQSEQSDEASYSAIKLECERALTAFRRGNHTKAMRLIKEASQRHEESALVHRCQATICAKVAGIIDEQTAKQRYLKSGIESARRACSLSPNSVEFAHFYANLLYEAAQEAKEYGEVVQECERALAIENPVDPGKESFQEEQKIPTAEGRVSNVQQELRSLIQKANIASISTWMKNFGTGNGEERFRLIPIRRPLEDPMEVGIAQTRRPNEIRKATKTAEEKRKEIEVRVAAARLLQQKSESQGESKAADDSTGRASSNSSKSSERRKHGFHRRNVASPERKGLVTSYWNSVSFEKKRDMLSIRVSDLRAHFSSLKDGLANEVLSEALSLGEMKKTWKCWLCCSCGEKFIDGESHVNHVEQEHMGHLMPKLQMVLPQGVNSEWAEMLLSCSWQPLDLDASTKMLENQLKFEDDEVGEKFVEEKGEEESKSSWTDSHLTEDVGSFSEKNRIISCNGSSLENSGNDKNFNVNKIGCKKVYALPNDSWPLSNDNERGQLLEKASSIFQALIRNKCLSSDLLQKVIQFTLDELLGLAPASPLLSCGIDQTPLCMCFLGADQLKKLIKFLQDVSHACGVGRYPEKIGPDDAVTAYQFLESQDKLVLREDASALLLDEKLLLSDGIRGEVGSITPTFGDESCTDSTSDSLLSWMYAGPSMVEQLAQWSRAQEGRKQQSIELLQLLEKEFAHLQSMCERKYEHLGYEESLQGLEKLCIEEGKKRGHLMEFTTSGYDSLLRKRRDQIVESENDVFNRFELDAITNVLKDAENIKGTQHIYEETYAGVNSHLCDLESGQEDGKSKDYFDQVDACVEVAIQRQKEQLSVELSKIDARIMRNVSTIQQLEHRLESIAAIDYSSILLPLAKSFMRAHLEDLARKDATERSDAAREAFLAELALDSKKTVGAGTDHSKHSQEKSKDKKKNRDSRKTKNAKVSSFSDCTDSAEPADSYNAASDSECVDSEMPLSKSDDELRSMENLRISTDFEAEERKLEEILEYQRRIEHEAKQRHLAEQWRTAQTTSGDISEQWSDVSSLDCIPVQEQAEKEAGVGNSIPENFSYAQSDAPDGTPGLADYPTMAQMQETKSSLSCKTLTSQVLSKKVVEHDNATHRMGKKGRQEGHAKLPEGYYQPLPAGKDNLKAGISKVENWEENCDEASLVDDNGSRTLGQLHAEEDAEERFQADLEMAVRQSLDTSQTNRRKPMALNSRSLPGISEAMDHNSPMGEVVEEDEDDFDVPGIGLDNEVGEYNCFLNVIIQSLWHVLQFREKFLSRPAAEHFHVGNPCVVCALHDVFMALNKASTDAKRETVSPTSLRIALSNLCPESSFFHEGQMNDASEVLLVIFDCLHRSVTSASNASDVTSASWDCASSACVAHSLFGMNIFERMNCYNCGLESRHMKYTSFFHNVNASAVRTMKVMSAESSFDELLNSVEMNHQLACDAEAGGCGKLNHIHHILSTPPHVFTTVLGWQNSCENVDDIAATLTALSTEIDISVLYRGVDPKHMHHLVSVVCYYGQHYHCFAYNQDSGQWIMYDDKMVKVIGSWEDVVAVCVKGHLQPQVLFYQSG